MTASCAHRMIIMIIIFNDIRYIKWKGEKGKSLFKKVFTILALQPNQLKYNITKYKGKFAVYKASFQSEARMQQLSLFM